MEIIVNIDDCRMRQDNSKGEELRGMRRMMAIGRIIISKMGKEKITWGKINKRRK